MINVDVPAEQTSATASKLLAAAQELGLPANVVATTSSGMFGIGFVVPDEVAEAAGLTVKAKAEAEAEVAPKAPAKRAVGRPRRTVEPTED